jgi:HD-like signal output (HDOD) protein
MKNRSSSACNRRILLERLEGDRLLPSLSPITSKVIELASDEDNSVREIATLIEKDPALTTQILKLANSVFFKALCPITTVRQAVLRLGVQQTRVLALSLSLRDTFPMGRVGNADYAQYWRLSLYQGILARSLAEHLGKVNPEEAFTAAFILEIGLPILMKTFAENGEEPFELNRYPLTSLLKWEKKCFGMDHREIGEIILSRWKFPESIVLCQRSYLTLRQGGSPHDLARICNIASELSAFICGSKVEFQEVFERMENIHGLARSVVNEVVATSMGLVNEIAETITLEIDSSRDEIELMEKANRALINLSKRLIYDHTSQELSVLPSFSALRVSATGADIMKQTLEAIAHEIRNPLTAVGGFTRRLAKTIDPASPSWKYVEAILTQTDKLEKTLKDMGNLLGR